jgi:hypothetical protein
MDNLNDAYLDVLRDYSGSVDDKRKAYLMEYLNYTNTTSLNDLEWDVLKSLGHTNSLTDAWLDHLKSLGGLTLSDKGKLLGSTFYGGSPLRLFINSEQGVWYDPSDLTTLFQDSAGTTPVTAAGQPVGLMLDKSKGLALGAELVSNGDFSNGLTGWSDAAGDGSAAVVDGVLRITQGATAQEERRQVLTVQAGRTYIVSATLGGVVPILFLGSSAGNAEYGSTAATGSRIFTATTTVLSLRAIPFSPLGSGSIATYDNISVRELGQGGNHATQATSARRPTYQIDASGRPYLAFDGVDDGMVTSAIDFSATDAVTVFAGLLKRSNAARAFFVELGISMATGGFSIEAPSGALNDIALFSGGTAPKAIGAVVAAPTTCVMSGQAKISTDLLKIRINGVDAGSNSADQGAGNYSNSVLYIGHRGGTTLPFNGRLYSLIIRGAESTAGQITSTETWVNRKTGAY